MSRLHKPARKARAMASYCLLAATSLSLHVTAALAWESFGDSDSYGTLAAAQRSATLSWNPPTKNSNGTQLTNLSGYRIYTGKTRTALKARVTVKNPGLSRYVVEPLAVGERYFSITALNTKGVESTRSAIVDAGPVN
jgi:hypothetical protein